MTLRRRPFKQPVMSEADIQQLSFEAALAELETIVRKLEGGDTTLEASIDMYTRGQALKAHCQAKLDAAQARIEAIQQNAAGDAVGTRVFDAA